MRRRPFPRGTVARRLRAFTLIETLIAIVLFAGLLTAATAVLIQVSEMWASQADDPIIDRHVDGLERFVRRVFSESGPTGVTAPTTDQMAQEGALLAVVPPADLPWTDVQALAGGAISGRFALPPNDGGLWLYWNTARETSTGVTDPHRVLLSPWVVSAQIFIYDATNTKWLPVDAANPVDNVGGVGTATTYRVLRLVVVRSGQTRTIEVPLPKTAT